MIVVFFLLSYVNAVNHNDIPVWNILFHSKVNSNSLIISITTSTTAKFKLKAVHLEFVHITSYLIWTSNPLLVFQVETHDYLTFSKENIKVRQEFLGAGGRWLH